VTFLNRYSLGIVQSHTTQFDGPLFRRLSASSTLNLTVYYVSQEALKPSFDPELQHRAGWDHDIISGYRYHIFPSSFVKQFHFAKKIVKSGHDLIIVAGYNSLISLIIAMLGKLYCQPVGLRSDTVLIYKKTDTLKSKVKDVVLPLLLKIFMTGHPTGTLASVYLKAYGFSKKSLFLFPYSVDNDYIYQLYKRAVHRRNLFRRELGIQPNDFVILGILKFVPREDPLTLLYAYHQIFQLRPDAHLLLVGDGPLYETITRYIASNALQQVHLAGYVPYSYLPDYYAVSDIYVHPAKKEPWGVSVNEAMVCGLPVIAADMVGAAKDLVIEGETGFTFPSGDSEALALIITKLAKNQGLCKMISENTVERISLWSYEATLCYLLEALRHVKHTKK